MDKSIKVVIEAAIAGAILGLVLPMTPITTILAISLGFFIGMKGPFIL